MMRCVNDRMKFLHAGFQIVVDQQIIICFDPLRLLLCPPKPLVNDLLGLRPPAQKPASKLLCTRRCHKEQDGIRVLFLYGECPLDLNLEDHIASESIS